jgi:hypothetical protein
LIEDLLNHVVFFMFFVRTFTHGGFRAATQGYHINVSSISVLCVRDVVKN